MVAVDLCEYADLVRDVARSQWHRLALVPCIALDFDDLVAAAEEALVRAAAVFDPSRGVPFAAFVTPRLTWAVRNEVRTMSWTSRYAVAKCQSSGVRAFFVVPVDDLTGVIDETDPLLSVVATDEVRRLHAAIDALPERERFVVVERFWRHRSTQDIGAAMQVHASRVSQIMTDARRHLAELIA